MSAISRYGPIIKVLRERAGKSQGQLSEILGKSLNYLNSVEQGEQELNEAELQEILSFLSVDEKEYLSLLKTQAFLDSLAEYELSEKVQGDSKPDGSSPIEFVADREEIIKILAKYFENKPVKKVFLFGSVARNEHHAQSDIDLLVEFNENHKTTLFDIIDIKDDLEEQISLKVDVVLPGSAYPHILEEMERDKILIYG